MATPCLYNPCRLQRPIVILSSNFAQKELSTERMNSNGHLWPTPCIIRSIMYFAHLNP